MVHGVLRTQMRPSPGQQPKAFSFHLESVWAGFNQNQVQIRQALPVYNTGPQRMCPYSGGITPTSHGDVRMK